MNDRIVNARAVALRARRGADFDAVTLWVGVMTFLILAAGASLAAH